MSEEQGDKPEPQDEPPNEDRAAPEQEASAAPDAEISELDKALAERDRMREQLLRIAADFENFRKRSRKEVEEVRRRAIEDTLREVLPVIDNLERATAAMPEASDVSAVAQGVQMVLRSFDDIANRLGLQRVPAVGHQFDPNCHDAMQQLETDEHAPGTIVAEVVPGYYLGDRLLRPAMVVVAKPPSRTDDQQNGSGRGPG
ncbi:MAG: nucleotide exchange factor GrpE [Myxococcales bacterium]|jgi:molecular chaperone GrpE